MPVDTLDVGDGEGQIGARKITRTLAKLKPVLTNDEMATGQPPPEVDPEHPPQGIPAGIDPTKVRMDRRSLR